MARRLSLAYVADCPVAAQEIDFCESCHPSKVVFEAGDGFMEC